MPKRTGLTLADVVVIALSPVLIMALVGSLVFFLLEVLYAGQYPGRMQWILFFFVFGAVLIARISMVGEIANRAGLYGAVLGLLVWIALLRFVEYPAGSTLARYAPFVSLGLIAITWWCAHRLTWDCTHIDDTAEATDQGVLQAAGLEPTAEAAEDVETDIRVEDEPAQKRPGWLERYRRYRDERQRRHTPGVWVVWFSLAALPLFGLGQSLIPPADVGRRRYAFWLLGIYTASGLGLLLTTAFLTLRRYLRQRGLKMPEAITSVWLGVGGILIVTILVLGALLPRPSAEYPLVKLDWLTSPEREASRQAMKGDGGGKDDGRPSEPGKDGENRDDGTARKDGEPDPKDRGSGAKQGRDGPKDAAGKNGSSKDAGEKRASGKEASSSKGEQTRSGSEPSPPTSPASGFAATFAGLMNVLRWVVFAVLAVIVAVIVLKALLQFLANFTGWARGLLDSLRALWQRLMGLWPSAGSSTEPVESEPAAPAPRLFASFANPFNSGLPGLPPEELARYSFAALEAWAEEHHLGRASNETALEFAARIAVEVPPLEADAPALAGLFVLAAYARGPLPPDCRVTLQRFWQRLEAVAEQPLSA